jgi:phosphate transport system substrate-binding protein
MKTQLAFISSAALLCAAMSSAVLADTVKLHGATTVIDVVIAPHRNAVQQASGHTLELVGNGTGKGLVDLSEGKADASLVSEPMDIALAAAAAAGKTIDPATLKMYEIRKDEIMFVVHPSNPVGSLTWDQIRDIHIGKTTNWKQVGGKDLPINVYSDALTGGTRAMVKKVVLRGTEYSDSVKSLTAVKRVAELVAQDAQGIGGVGRGFVDTAKDKVLKTAKIERPLAFVTVGEASPKVKQVIEAFRAEVKKAGK